MSASYISQKYFDELCIENYETFEMSSEEEAVSETVLQLQSLRFSMAHLSVTYPSTNKEIREEIRDFHAAIRKLETIGSDLVEEIQQSLETIQRDLVDERSDQRASVFAHLFLAEKGFLVYFSLFSKLDICWDAIKVLLLTVHELVERSNSREFRTAFQAAVPVAMTAWTNLYEQELAKDSSEKRIGLLLSILYESILRCEANKALWMNTQTKTSSFVSLMLETIKTTGEYSYEIGCTVCRILTVMCTFDDFRTENDAATPVVQSSHNHVHALAEAGAVPTVHHLLLQVEGNSAVAAAAVSTLRALGIQDGIVQCMVTIGVLQTASRLLRETLHRGASDDSTQLLITAILGLFRNVAANDDIKTTMCTGRLQSVVTDTIQAMQLYPAAALLQEHACGLTGAMALRKPKNAAHLVGQGMHLQIVAAMQQHPGSVTLQRQASMALRNLVARSPELRAAVLDSAAEETLRNVAAKHLQCQDEVYAALRDLGLSVSSVHIHQLDDGKTFVREERQMFGERNPNFRAVYE